MSKPEIKNSRFQPGQQASRKALSVDNQASRKTLSAFPKGKEDGKRETKGRIRKQKVRHEKGQSAPFNLGQSLLIKARRARPVWFGKKSLSKKPAGQLGQSTYLQIKTSQKFLACLLGALIAFIMVYVLYKNLYLSLLATGLGALVGLKKYQAWQKQQREASLLLAFRETLDFLSSAYAAGKNSRDSFTSALQECRFQYGQESYLVQALADLVAGLQAGDSLERRLSLFAQALPLQEIEDFVFSFLAVYRQGGDLKQLVERTRQVISRQIEVKLEIETIIFEQKRQVFLLLLAPYFLIALVDASGLSFQSSLTLASYLVRTVALGFFVGAYLWAKKIIKGLT